MEQERDVDRRAIETMRRFGASEGTAKKIIELACLVREDLGVYSIGPNKDEISLRVMEGMPEDFKDVLKSAAPDFSISVLEVEEPLDYK